AIWAAFSRMAALASAAWVTTPADAVATSGARLASPVAETDSRVPSLLAGWTAGVCAEAGMARLPVARTRARTAARVIDGVMVVSRGRWGKGCSGGVNGR